MVALGTEISLECILSAAIHSQHIVAKHCSSWKFFSPMLDS
jgi:hypothetical protein